MLVCTIKEPHLLGVGLVWSRLFIGLPRVFHCFSLFFSLLYWSSLSLILVLQKLFSFIPSELFQVSVAEMIGLQQYRLAIGCFVSFHASLTSKSCEYVRAESKNVISVCRDSVHFAILLVLLTFLCKLLLLGGDIETNPGPPTRKCPQCSALIHIRKHSCDCGHILVKRGKKALERRQCPQCASLVAINKPRCCCGYSFKIIDAYNTEKKRAYS